METKNDPIHTPEHRRADGIALISQVARQINASLDLRETLDAIVCAAAELVPCTLAAIDLWDEPRQRLVLQALHSSIEQPFTIGQTFSPGEGYTGWVVRNKKPLLVPDVEARKDIRPRLLPGERPFKAYLGLPLLAGDELIGDLQLVHEKAGAFDEDDLRLLEALAGQAAIAIRNAHIYGELNRRHQEHAALSSVTVAINRHLALQDLLESALDSVLTVTQADGGGIRLLDRQTNELTLAAYRGLSDTYVREASRFPISREIVGEVARTGQARLCDDMWIDPRVSPEVRGLLQQVGHRSLAQAPVVSQEQVVGTLGITSRTPGFFNQDDLRLLIAIGQQLGIAIERAQLFEEVRRQAHRLTVLNAVAAVVNQPLPLQEIMDRAISKVVEVMETDAGGIRLLDQETGKLPIISSQGLSPEHIQAVSCQQLGEGIAGQVALSGEPQVVKDVSRDPRVISQAILEKEGFNTFAVVPLKAKDVIVGTLGVVTRQHRDFTPEEIELLTTLGDQIGVAVETARLRQEALRAARLAAVGRVAAGVAHDLRSPLGGILRCAEFLDRSEISPDTRHKLSGAIVSLARRLIVTSQGILDYIQGEKLSLQLAPVHLADYLDELLDVFQIDFSDQGIEVVRDYLFKGDVILDSDRMAQVIYNIAENARDAMPRGGRFTITTRKRDAQIELRFSDTGPGVPSQFRERIFEPFFTYGKYHGAGLGLAIARQIVNEHGGKIWLESAGDQGSTFIVSLPA